MALSNIFNTFNLVYITVLRSIERPIVGTVILTSSMLVKVVLNIGLTLGSFGLPGLGVVGAGLATLIARLIEFIIIIVHMYHNKFFRVKLDCVLHPGMDMFKKYLANAGTVVINETIWGMGMSSISNVMSHMKDSASILTAYSISASVEQLASSLTSGIASAIAVVVGIEVGSERPKEVIKEIAYALCVIATAMGVLAGGLFFYLGEAVGPAVIYPMYDLVDSTAKICGIMITMKAILLPLRSLNNAIVIGILRGGGDVHVAAFIDVLPLWLAAVPYAVIVGKLGLGIVWVELSYFVQHVTQFISGFARLRSGKWIKDMT